MSTELNAFIALHRALLKDELSIRLTVRNVPSETEEIPVDVELEAVPSMWSRPPWDRERTPAYLHQWESDPSPAMDVTDSGALGGTPLSPAMNRRLSPPAGYGQQFPWAGSWFYLRHACIKDHPGHKERPVFRGALCWQIVNYVVVQGFTPSTTGNIVEIPTESVERLLRAGMRWIEEDMDRKQRIHQAREAMVRPSEEPTPTRLSLLQCDAAYRQIRDFDLEERIWTSYRRLHPELELVSWEDEWARRQRALWEHQQQCDRCRRAA